MMISRRKLLQALAGLPFFGGLMLGVAKGENEGLAPGVPEVELRWFGADGVTDEDRIVILDKRFPERRWSAVHEYKYTDKDGSKRVTILFRLFCGVAKT